MLDNQKVSIELDSTQGERDKYGRLLLYVFLQDGTLINKTLISEGYAHEYTYNKPYKYQSEFKQAQKDAQENQRGLWAVDACNVSQASSGQSPSQPTSSPPIDSTQTISVDGHTWYVSSHYSSRFYYCDTDETWKGLSEKYRRSYTSETALRADYPNHTLHESCK